MVGPGKAEGALDAGNMLKPALARGELHCVGATTLDEYREYIEKDAALERRFQKVQVDDTPTLSDELMEFNALAVMHRSSSIIFKICLCIQVVPVHSTQTVVRRLAS